ncbi:MAG TPA: B12-binding domain-containing protein [Acidimicrobiales bacterium]|nr:B12-binding domain-containing protein [Acidimicrobiales bacterium]
MDLSAAARQLGIHYQTAYRWVREGRLSAVKVAGSYHVTEDEVARVAARRSEPAPPTRRSPVRNWGPPVERFTDLLLAGDELGARAVVERLAHGGVQPVQLMDSLLAPSLRRIGQAWEEGSASVAVEHRATSVCERLIARLSVHPRGRPRGVCLVATPPGERHSLPAAMAAIALRANRWQVHHLGADVPAADLLELATTVGADLLVLSVATEPAQETAAGIAGRLVGSPTRALVGRPGASLVELLRAARRSGPGPGQAVEYAPDPSTA